MAVSCFRSVVFNWLNFCTDYDTPKNIVMYKRFIAGLGGAIALTILHETVRKNCKNAPEINKVGEEALEKSLNQFDASIDSPDKLYAATLVGDVVGNGIYYAGTATNKAGLLSGLAMGVGTVLLPRKIGLDDAPVAENNQKKMMTIGYYLFGALVTKLIYDQIK